MVRHEASLVSVAQSVGAGVAAAIVQPPVSWLSRRHAKSRGADACAFGRPVYLVTAVLMMRCARAFGVPPRWSEKMVQEELA